MHFWNDMRSKWGFGDGGAVPTEASAARSVYIRTVNQLAEARGSAVRAVAYDRPGAHNWCLIATRTADALAAEGIGPARYHEPVEDAGDEAEWDEGFGEAVDRANELRLDAFVVVDIRIDEDALATRLSLETERATARRA